MTTKTAIYNHAVNLFPICRSLSGSGVVETLSYIKKFLPNLNVETVKSGTQVFDWNIPQEWNINDAYVANSKGERVIDFNEHNLHILGYSEPFEGEMTFEELDAHLYSLPEQPDAIPYITSYYKRRWGFCLTENLRNEMRKSPKEKYHVKVDTTLEDGDLNYGELIIKGQTDEEILISTYICHPSMANNELSGPCVTLELASWLESLQGEHHYTYRILFLVETIGSIIYLSKHLEYLKKHLKAGYVLSCVGDNLDYSVVNTPDENTASEIALEHVLKHHTGKYSKYPFTQRGSDERQYCSAGVDLPVAGFCRSKYAEFPEYHTSLDDLDFISEEGLFGAYEVMQKVITLFENNAVYKTKVLGEPQLGKRGLYPSISTKETAAQTRDMMNLIAYSNGSRSLLEIAEKTNTSISKFYPIVPKLLEADVMEKHETASVCFPKIN
jgi:aminopeptidase-like protein